LINFFFFFLLCFHIIHILIKDTGEVLFASDTKLAVDVRDKRVTFEQDEVKQIKRFGPTGMKLLGFKSMSHLKPYMYVKPGHFIYPDEKVNFLAMLLIYFVVEIHS